MTASSACWARALRNQEGPAWGLFYADDDEDAESVRYRPRNDVVTDIIVQAVNGGQVATDGEVTCLERLLRACDGTAPVYEQFCVNALVPSRKLEDYSLEQGIRLYDAAIQALPYGHRTLLHHKSNFMRKKGARFIDVRADLAAAMTTPDTPHGSGDAPEFLHTSMAAAVVAAIGRGELGLEIGTKEAMRELERARSNSFVNPKAAHVAARLFVQLVKGQSAENRADRVLLAARALADIDRTLLLGAPRGVQFDKGAFVSVREELLHAALQGITEADALQLYQQHQSQDGFVCLTRARMQAAWPGQTGSQWKQAWDQWEKYVAIIGSENLSPEMAETGATLYYQWQVRPRSRGRPGASGVDIAWQRLFDLGSVVVQSARYKDDALQLYIWALASFHVKQYASGRRTFERLRNMKLGAAELHEPRDYWLDQNGDIWRLQGNPRTDALRGKRLEIGPEIGAVKLREENWPRGNAAIHCHVVFSFAGPLATRRNNLLQPA